MKKNEWAGYFLIAPAYLLMAFVIIYPTIYALWMSFHNIILTRPDIGRPFIGLKNYVDVIRSPYFANAAVKTFIWTAVNLVVQMVFGMVTALVITREFRGRGLARGIVLIPWITPAVVAYLTWRWMYDAQFGIINTFLVNIGILESGIAWLGNMQTAFGSVMVASIWKGTPFVTIMLLAALQSISNELYDAGKVDGASGFQQFLYITMPQIMPTFIIAATLTTIFTFNNFNAVWLLTAGGPLRSSEVFNIMVYRIAFQDFNLGRATAAGMMVFLMLYLFVLIFGRSYVKAQARRS